MIVVTDIKPAKSNSEWELVVVSNIEDKYVKALTERCGFVYEPKNANIPVLKKFNKFKRGQIFQGKEVITIESETSFWERQRPLRNGKYYNNIIVDTVQESELIVELTIGISEILKKHEIRNLQFENFIRINGFTPKMERLVRILDFLQLKYKILTPSATPDSDEEVVRKTFVENVCLVIGHKTKPVLVHLMTYVGTRIFKNNNFKVFVSYTTYDSEDYGNLCNGNSDNLYFNLNYYSNNNYHNISSPIEPSDFLKLDFTSLSPDYLEKAFPNLYPSSEGYIEYMPEDNSRGYSSVDREKYEADRDAFDALTDGQYGDFDNFRGDIDNARDYMGY